MLARWCVPVGDRPLGHWLGPLRSAVAGLVDAACYIASTAVPVTEGFGCQAVAFGADRNPDTPDAVLTSTMADWGSMIVQVFLDMQDPSFDHSHDYMWGLETPFNYLAPYHGLVADDVAAEVEKALEQIRSGELVVSEDTNEPE